MINIPLFSYYAFYSLLYFVSSVYYKSRYRLIAWSRELQKGFSAMMIYWAFPLFCNVFLLLFIYDSYDFTYETYENLY